MPAAKKNLHLAKTLQELKEQSTIYKTNDTHVKFDQKDPKALMNSAMKLYKKAMQMLNEKDEEMVYTYLYRAMELWMIIKDKNDDPKYITLMFGKELRNTMVLLEEYADKLEKRYADLQNGVEEENSSFVSNFEITPSIHTKKRKEVKEKNTREISTNGSSTTNSTTSDYSCEDFNLISSTASELGEFEREADYYGEKKFIQCEELKNLLKESSTDLLIFDLRPKTDFQLSQLTNVNSINIPDTSILHGLSANKLGETIDDATEKYYWKHRDQYKQIVLLDWYSEEKDVIPNSPLVNLQTILLKWDPLVVYKNKPLILNGGYERLLDTYPTFTTNPKIGRPPKHANHPFIPLSDHRIEYPMSEIEERYLNISKPENNEKQPKMPTLSATLIPSIDRTTKPENTAKKDNNSEYLDRNTRTLEMETDITEEEPILESKEPRDNEMEYSTIPPPFSSSQAERLEENSPEPFESHGPDQTPVRPSTPPRSEKPFTGTPYTAKDSARGDGVVLERIKDESITRSGGLKRSASSPNINKLVNDDLDLFDRKPSTPKFDRSIKPNDSYSQRGGAGVDTIYLANNKKGRGLTGLKNLGNLCYMNSIIQCISNTEELTRELTKFSADRKINGKRQIASEVSILLGRLWQGDLRITSCRDLKMIVGNLRPSFSTMEQQDSHEFLTILVDWLHEDLNEHSPVTCLVGANETTGEKAWGEFRKKNHSLILDLFYGQLKSTVKCKQCNKQSVSFEPFSNLSVPLPQDTPYDKDKRFSLQDCLNVYLKPETISGWICPGCKAPREATKKLDITRLPPILIIHLKRFMTEMAGLGWCRKRMNMVDFPISDFDMKPFTHSDSELRFHKYNLYAVSNHYGSMESGHYTAYCKNHMLNKWYKFDDQDVNDMSPADVKSSAAYILFYETSQIQQRNDRITGYD